MSATSWAFAAVRNDGSVVTWGDPQKGGDSHAVQDILPLYCLCASCFVHCATNNHHCKNLCCDESSWQEQLEGVKSVCAASYSFAALRRDGSAGTWGSDGTSSQTSDELLSAWAFAPKVVTWGMARRGGDSRQH